jgi:HAE1 family hydrophobic/amphiphilic exporter-1
VVPLAIATGAGQLGRHSIGTTIIGGMLLSTVLNLFFIPVLYAITVTITSRFSRHKKHTNETEIAAVR